MNYQVYAVQRQACNAARDRILFSVTLVLARVIFEE